LIQLENFCLHDLRHTVRLYPHQDGGDMMELLTLIYWSQNPNNDTFKGINFGRILKKIV